MRKLTFEGFLKQYVAELSGVQTASIHKLADCLQDNPRLKESLFLYALAFNKVELLLRYTANSAVAAEYEQHSNRYSLAQMRLLLEKQSPELPEGYLKVWRSYCSVRDAALADNDTKELIHRRVLELQQKKEIDELSYLHRLEAESGQCECMAQTQRFQQNEPRLCTADLQVCKKLPVCSIRKRK